jgi:AMP phosphorylase
MFLQLIIKNYEMNVFFTNYVVIHPSTALHLDLSPGTLIKLVEKDHGFQIITSTYIDQDCAGISNSLLDQLELNIGEKVTFQPIGIEGVSRIIKKKMYNQSLSREDISVFMSALSKNLLTDGHIGAFGTALEINGMNMDEVSFVAEAILENSKKLTHKTSPVVDKHSIGGIAGNRITPIMVPIIAAAGLTIPKISTRAITSPSGTIDALDVVMPVELTIDEVNDTVRRTMACMVDGLKIGLGDVADKFLKVVKQVKIDPREMMIASILAKKKAAGSQYVLIDLPTGPGSKLPTRVDARKLAYDFSNVGNKMEIKVESVVSPGDKPIGKKIGPVLEITEVLQILKQTGGAYDLRRKALSLSGLIFENMGKAARGQGYELAKEYLKSGKAYQKFCDISVAQGGPESFDLNDLPKAPYAYTIKSEGSDKVYGIDSLNIGIMAQIAGAPNDRVAGVELHIDRGDIISIGDPLITIYANSESKIDEAIAVMHTASPFSMEKSVLEYIKDISFVD